MLALIQNSDGGTICEIVKARVVKNMQATSKKAEAMLLLVEASPINSVYMALCTKETANSVIKQLYTEGKVDLSDMPMIERDMRSYNAYLTGV